MDDTTAAYLAGYLERGGTIRIYVNQPRDEKFPPVIETSRGDVSIIESAGIYVRVRATDMTVLRLLKELFDGKLTRGQWQGWNEDAAVLLRAILPYLRTGKRKAVMQLVLDFHAFIERKREWATASALFFTAEDVEVIGQYEAALREITESR